MSEASSALPGAAFDGLVHVEEAGLRGMVSLRADLADAKVRKAVKSLVGVGVPDSRRVAMEGGKGALWMSPDELLLVMPHGEAGSVVAGLTKALAGVHHLAAEVSDARVVFRLTGDLQDVREVLARLTPADMSPAALETGEVRRTRLGQVAAAFWIEDGGVTLVAFRSVARYVFDLLSNAAASQRVGIYQVAENGPPVAFVTMVRDERIFLPLWVRYYARFVPRENLFVIMDGLDQSPPPECEGCQVLRLPQRPAVAGWDIARWQMLSDFAAALLGRFETVVLNDVDELVVLDPQFGTDLVSELRATREAGVISPFALEIVHRADLEPEPFDSSRPVLDQRRYVRLNASYCKPCIASERVRWSIGGHRSDFPRLSLSRRLFLFHLKYVDRDLLLARQAQRRAHVTESGVPASEVAGSGWRKSSSRAEAFLDSFVANGPPEVHDFSFDWQRRRIEESWKLDEASGFWTHCRLHNRRTYVLPDRFRGLMQESDLGVPD